MNLPYFTIIHWLTIAFFIILFIALSLLSAQSKKTNIVISGIFASFLVTTFGAVLGIIILEKYTKKGMMVKVKERRILFNETMFIKGYIQNVGKFPLNYCKVSIKLVNNDRDNFGKGSFFKSSGFNVFGSKDKKLAKPNTVFKEKVFKFKPTLKPNYIEPFSIALKYPGYFKNTMIIKKIYCH